MRKFIILFFILLAGCVDRPYNEAYFIGEGEDIIEPEEDIVEPEEDVYEEDVVEDTYEPEENVVEDVIEPEEDIERDTVWEFDAVEEDVVSVDADDEDTWVDTYIPEDTWQPEDTYTPQDTYQPPQDTWTPPQDTYTPPKDTYQPPQDTNKPEDTKPQLGPGECPKDCKTWYDGCNSCQCNGGKIGGCTKMYCPTKKEPYCKKLHGT
jgi:hypothetical protein